MTIFGIFRLSTPETQNSSKYQNSYKTLYYSLSEPDAPNISKDGPYRMTNGEMVADSA